MSVTMILHKQKPTRSREALFITGVRLGLIFSAMRYQFVDTTTKVGGENHVEAAYNGREVRKCLQGLLTYPHNDPLAGLAGHGVVVVVGVRVQPHHQLEVALIGVRLALLAHVVAGGLAEVQPTYGHLGHLTILQLHPGQKATRGISQGALTLIHHIHSDRFYFVFCYAPFSLTFDMPR